MTSRRVSNKGKASVKKADLEKSFITTEGRESLWEFDEEHDVITVAAQLVSEYLIKDNSFNFASYSQLQEQSTNEVNMSDITIIITAALLNRLGAAQAASDILSESDEASNFYMKLHLDDRAVLNTFSILISVMAPEMLKSAEMAMLIKMARRARTTKVTHSSSRLISALNDLNMTGIISEPEVNIASFNSNFTANDSSSKLIEFIASKTDPEKLDPSESVSQRVSPASSNLIKRSFTTRNSRPLFNERDLREHVRRRRNDPEASFDDDFPDAEPPVKPKGNKGNLGLGYATESASMKEIGNRIKRNREISRVRERRNDEDDQKTKFEGMIKDLGDIQIAGFLPEVDDDSLIL